MNKLPLGAALIVFCRVYKQVCWKVWHVQEVVVRKELNRRGI